MAQTFDSPLTTNDDSIDRVLAFGLPVVLVFLNGAASPALENAMKAQARENAGSLLIVKVPVKDSPNSRRRFEIDTTPALTAISAKGQVLSKAETATEADLLRHIAFLTGKGPKPEAPRPVGGPPNASTPINNRPLTATDASFDLDVLRSPQPVLVDFWAPWCGPCRMVGPIVEKLAHEYAGKMRFIKINVDENPLVSGRYGIQSIPTMLVVRDGKIVDRWAGALPEPALRGRIAPYIR